MLQLANPLHRWFLAGWLHSLRFPVIVLHDKRWCVMHDHSSAPTSLHEPALRGRGTCSGPKEGFANDLDTPHRISTSSGRRTWISSKRKILVEAGNPVGRSPMLSAFCFLTSHRLPAPLKMYFTLGPKLGKEMAQSALFWISDQKQYETFILSSTFHKISSAIGIQESGRNKEEIG